MPQTHKKVMYQHHLSFFFTTTSCSQTKSDTSRQQNTNGKMSQLTTTLQNTPDINKKKIYGYIKTKTTEKTGSHISTIYLLKIFSKTSGLANMQSLHFWQNLCFFRIALISLGNLLYTLGPIYVKKVKLLLLKFCGVCKCHS